jgi:DNA-binding MarR family transcriptional regulator
MSRQAADAFEGPTTVSLLDAVLTRLGGEIIATLHNAGFTDARPIHGRVMSQLHGGEGRRLVDLAESAGMTAQAMGQLLDRLEAQGYVERRPDPTDRRAKLIHMSKKGEAGGAATRDAVVRQEESLREVLGAEAYVELRRTLQTLIETHGAPRS